MSDEDPNAFIDGEFSDGDQGIDPDSVTIETDAVVEFLRVGAIIRTYRQRAGWSQNELSRLADVEEGMIKRIERGHTRNPQNWTLERLAQAFAREFPSVTSDELLQDFIDAKNKVPSRFDADPEAKIISARMKPYSTKLRKKAYTFISRFLDFLDDTSELGES